MKNIPLLSILLSISISISLLNEEIIKETLKWMKNNLSCKKN